VPDARLTFVGDGCRQPVRRFQPRAGPHGRAEAPLHPLRPRQEYGPVQATDRQDWRQGLLHRPAVFSSIDPALK